MYKVSVIIPVYNAEEYLERCLDSVCNQTLKDIEIICVNDCSKDNSLQILQDYSKKYPNLKVIDCKVNGGESIARNIGIDNATGEYLAFVDNDDVVDLDFYEKLYTEASKTGADIAKGEAKEIDYEGKIHCRSINEKIQTTGFKTYFVADWWTAIYKKRLIDEHNIKLPINVPLGGDILFLNQAVLEANKVATINRTYYTHIMRKNSGDPEFCSLEKIKSVIEIYNQILDNTNKYEVDKLEPEGYDHIFFVHIIALFERSFKNSSQECKTLCANAIAQMYANCKRQEEFDKSIETSTYRILHPYINNSQILADLLIKSPTREKLYMNAIKMNIARNFKRENLCQKSQ